MGTISGTSEDGTSGRPARQGLPGRSTSSLWAVLLACSLIASAAHAQVAGQVRSAGSQPSGATTTGSSLQDLWERLAGEEPLEAYKAVWALAAAGESGAALLEQRVGLAPSDPERLERLIASLDHEKHAVRETSFQALAAMGLLAEPALRRALASSSSPEGRSRINQLLRACAASGATPEGLRAARAVRVLEMIGSDRARRLLGRMAEASPLGCARAKEALARLQASTTQLADVDLTDQEILTASWQVCVSSTDLVEKILSLGVRVPAAAQKHTACCCDGDELLAALRPALGGRESPVFGDSFRLRTPPRSGVFNHWHASQHVPMSDGAHAYFHTSGHGRHQVSRRGGALRLTFEGELGINLHRHRERIEWKDALALDREVRPGQAIYLIADVGKVEQYRPYSVIVFQVLAVPKQLVRHFTSHGNLRPWVEHGYAGTARLGREGLAWNRMAERTKHESDPKWARKLPRGGWVRLVAVRRSDQHPFRWWDPDGRPLAAEPWNFRAGGSKALDLRIRFQRSADSEAGVSTRLHTLRLEGDTAPAVTVGLAAGPWKRGERLELGKPHTAGEMRCTLERIDAPVRKGWFRTGKVLASLRFLVQAEADFGVGAVDRTGKLTVPREHLQPMLGKPQKNSTGYASCQLAIDISDVDHYVLLTRPRDWTTFSDIAAQPVLSTTLPTE